MRLFATPCTVAHQVSLAVYFPGKNTGVGCHFLLQGIFPAQGLNPHLLHWQAGSWYHWATREAPIFVLYLLFVKHFNIFQWNIDLCVYIHTHTECLEMAPKNQAKVCFGLLSLQRSTSRWFRSTGPRLFIERNRALSSTSRSCLHD